MENKTRQAGAHALSYVFENTFTKRLAVKPPGWAQSRQGPWRLKRRQRAGHSYLVQLAEGPQTGVCSIYLFSLCIV